MDKRHYITLIIAGILSFHSIAQTMVSKHYLVKVLVANQTQKDLLLSLDLDLANTITDSVAEIIIREGDLTALQNHGFESQIIRELSSQPIDQEYHRYQQVLDLLENYSKNYPEITLLDTIGYSQRLGLILPAIKISDNASVEEDEPAVLFDGLHHAREPVGMECTLELMEFLLSNYGKDQQVTDWVDNTEIWIIPMMNPEGWYYLVENELANPWWRKNLRENGNNGHINSDYDGVDVNRNYDFNWISGGSGNPGSWTFRGPEAFSESEARAKRDLALSQKFILSLSYHSHGQVVIYSWREYPRAPDQDLIIEIADSIAKRIPRFGSDGNYSPSVSDCQNGFSRCWMYAGAGTMEYTIETAPSFMPSGADGVAIAKDNLFGALYILDRVRGPGLSGHIIDKQTGKPLEAEYRIMELYDDILAPRTSDRIYGRYDRLLQPGEYTLIVDKEGYLSDTIQNIMVTDGKTTELEVELNSVLSGIEDLHALPYNGKIGLSQNYPNPFRSQTQIKYYTSEAGSVKLHVYDLIGNKIASLADGWHAPGEYTIRWDAINDSGKKLPKGLYFYRLISKDLILSNKLIIN